MILFEREDRFASKLQAAPVAKKNPYKLVMLDSFRKIYDPFNQEIKGVTGGGINPDDDAFDYEANPADPSNPQKKVQIASIASVQ